MTHESSEQRRAVLMELHRLLWKIGSANDAEDHGCGAEAEQMRQDCRVAIRKLVVEHGFLVDVFPTLFWEVETGHVFGVGWPQLSDRLEEQLRALDTPQPTRPNKAPSADV
jgi:hypothetical protein